MNNIIITENILDQKVPQEIFSTRFDSATNIYVTLSGKYNGIILYNIRPEWNCFTSFYALNNKFTIDDYLIENKNITFRNLISIYDEEFKKTHINGKGYDIEKRKQTTIDEYCKLFDIKNVELGSELKVQYEIKFLKRMKLWTLYRIESFVLKKIDSINKLLDQKIYKQEIVPFDTDIIFNGVEILENVYEAIKDKSNIDILKQFDIRVV